MGISVPHSIAFVLALAFFLVIFTEGVGQMIAPLLVERTPCIVPAHVLLANPAIDC